MGPAGKDGFALAIEVVGPHRVSKKEPAHPPRPSHELAAKTRAEAVALPPASPWWTWPKDTRRWTSAAQSGPCSGFERSAIISGDGRGLGDRLPGPFSLCGRENRMGRSMGTDGEDVVIRPAIAADTIVLGRFGSLLISLHHELDQDRFFAATERTEASYAGWLERRSRRNGGGVCVRCGGRPRLHGPKRAGGRHPRPVRRSRAQKTWDRSIAVGDDGRRA